MATVVDRCAAALHLRERRQNADDAEDGAEDRQQECKQESAPSLSPPLLRLLAGGAIPAGRKLRYLDLGFGLGTTLNVHAAACPGEYWGCDINPLHVAAAGELARCAGTGVQLLQASFAELLERRDLPAFDIVVAHGGSITCRRREGLGAEFQFLLPSAGVETGANG